MKRQYSDEYHQQYWAGYDFDGKANEDAVADAREYVMQCCESNPYMFVDDGEADEDIMEGSETDELYIQFRAQEIAVERLCKNKLGTNKSQQV